MYYNYNVPVKISLQIVWSRKKNLDILFYSSEHFGHFLIFWEETFPPIASKLLKKNFLIEKSVFLKPGLGNLFLMSCILPILGYFSRKPKIQVFTATDIWE